MNNEEHEFVCDVCGNDVDELIQRIDIPMQNGSTAWICEHCNEEGW